uniref:Uncharacterized protein n=1 Tax=Anguilla anguilla TaxID=7936 RepID=A0A0E9WHU0_ANGAN
MAISPPGYNAWVEDLVSAYVSQQINVVAQMCISRVCVSRTVLLSNKKNLGSD